MERSRVVLAWLMGTLLLALVAVGGGDGARSQAGQSSNADEAAICPAYRPVVEARLVSVRQEAVYEEFGTPLGRCGFVIVQEDRAARANEETYQARKGTLTSSAACGEGGSAEHEVIAREALRPWLEWLSSLDLSAWECLRSVDWQFDYAGCRGAETGLDEATPLAALELPCELSAVAADPWFARAWGKESVTSADPWFARAWGKESVASADPWFARAWGKESGTSADPWFARAWGNQPAATAEAWFAIAWLGKPTCGGLGEASSGSVVMLPSASSVHLGLPAECDDTVELRSELPWWIGLAEPGFSCVLELPPPPHSALAGKTKVARGLELELCREPLVWLNVWSLLNQWTLAEPRGASITYAPRATAKESPKAVVGHWGNWLGGVDIVGELEAVLALNQRQDGLSDRSVRPRPVVAPVARVTESKYYDWSAHFHSLWRGTDLERPAAVPPLRHVEGPDAEAIASRWLEPNPQEGSHFELILDGPERFLYLRCREAVDWSREPAVAEWIGNGCTPLDHLAVRALREVGDLPPLEWTSASATVAVNAPSLPLLNWTDGWFGCEAFPGVAQQAQPATMKRHKWPTTQAIERWTDACLQFEQGLQACQPWLAVWGRLNQQLATGASQTSQAMLAALGEMSARQAEQAAGPAQQEHADEAAAAPSPALETEPSAVGASYGWESEMLLGL
jgi:hypothetical protein